MIIDKELELSDAQDLAGAGTGVEASTNVIDLGADRDIGRGKQQYLVIQCDETVDSAADGTTIDFQLQTDTVENFASPTNLVTTGAIAELAAETTAGGRKVIPIPEGVQRYLRLNYQIAGEDPTAGKFTAFITDTVPDYDTSYPDAL